ncbi:hypothetical protein [Holospora undulata]|uniref:Outer membrane protein beta-barrel domain-containing protein n=1 Tax=Holospora undulata HU1 TaxID=1321371 RepID=A0A061JFY5_9PROT|nr:hypothetical protein [Holospora undulata]ETZ04650.1 hypothetical protein K737_300944 [Holospora undulata HU1]
MIKAFFLLAIFFSASSLSAKKDKFLSGIGIIVEIGGATLSITPGGSGSTRCSIQAETFGKNNQVVQGKFSIANELNNDFYLDFYGSINNESLSVRSRSEGITKMDMKPQFLHPENSCAVNTVSCENSYFTVEGTTSTSAKIDFDVTSVKIEGIQDNLIDFGQKGEVRNRSGFSWNFGVLIQKVFDSYTMGGRCVFGANNDAALLKYKTGIFSLDLEERNDFTGEFEIPDQSRTVFRLRNKWFAEFIFEFGYIIARRLQLFVGPGIVLQKQELSCMKESRQSPSSLSKTIMGGVLACGTRYALNRHVALGLEYQRQCFGKKNWDNIASIVPQDMYCCGTPITKTNANLFLVTLSCVFFGK